ncbi:MAG: hypothetical protein M1834_007110 [Cirrosporium novae-zelandiae]|nr:MAG: hypothetical protein M1834_007110 [Cirrosporium novae-zelandiae]
MHENESKAISTALNILCNAPEEAFQSHRSKVILTFTKLQKLSLIIDAGLSSARNNAASTPPPRNQFRSPLSSSEGRQPRPPSPDNRGEISVSLSCCDTISTEDSTISLSPLNTRNEDPENKACKGLLKKLEKRYDRIFDYLKKDEPEAIGEPRWLNDDSRVIDLTFNDTASPQDDQALFRKLLSRRSLALDYLEWEATTFESSKVVELIENPSKINGRTGHINQYVRSSHFNLKEVATRGIQHGIKLCSIEKLVGFRGILALLAFAHHDCSRLKQNEMNYLRPLLQSESFSRLYDLAEQKSQWFETCEALYLEQHKKLQPNIRKRVSSFPQPKVKHPRLDVANSNHRPDQENPTHVRVATVAITESQETIEQPVRYNIGASSDDQVPQSVQPNSGKGPTSQQDHSLSQDCPISTHNPQTQDIPLRFPDDGNPPLQNNTSNSDECTQDGLSQYAIQNRVPNTDQGLNSMFHSTTATNSLEEPLYETQFYANDQIATMPFTSHSSQDQSHIQSEQQYTNANPPMPLAGTRDSSFRSTDFDISSWNTINVLNRSIDFDLSSWTSADVSAVTDCDLNFWDPYDPYAQQTTSLI